MSNKSDIIYSVNQVLPDNGETVLCFGHKTLCCIEDMDKVPDWHIVTFILKICQYKLKNLIPTDPEESILQNYTVTEFWECEHPEDGYIIGVTKWKDI